MQVIYFSTALSDNIYIDIVQSCRKFKPTFSGVGFDRNVALGLSEYVDINGVSRFPIPSWPKYTKLFQKSSCFEIDRLCCFVPQMINLPIIKEESFYRSSISYIKNKIKMDNETVVVISGLYRSLLKPAIELKKRYGYKLCAIVPDLPELMITYRNDYSYIRRIANTIDMKNTEKYFDNIDAFVFLSKYMNEVVNKSKKPFLVVDGLTNISEFPPRNPQRIDPYILYAGKVSATFGIDRLVKAFLKADIDKNIKLHICGDGDYQHELDNIIKNTDRIIYHGIIPHDKVLELEANAELLVDPRPSNMQIVKMSFPSKIIEYMASGTPVLTTNLPCFSEEYKKYQFRIIDESESGIASALQLVFQKSSDERHSVGLAAQQFVLQNKTLSKQCQTIMDFLNEIDK